MALEYNAQLAARIDFGPELSLFRIVPTGWGVPDFQAGQFTTLGLNISDKLIRRAYSIASPPKIRDYIEFYIVLVKEGVLTPRLWDLKVGDSLYMSPKTTGKFVMDSIPQDQNIVMVGTGTGIAPFVSMLFQHLNPKLARKFAIIHGVRVSQDLGYRTTLLHMSRLFPQVHYFPIVSRPQNDPIPWKGLTGHVQDVWKSGAIEAAWGFKPSSQNTHVFLCGAPQMIAGMTEDLKTVGYLEDKPSLPGNIHAEKYW